MPSPLFQQNLRRFHANARARWALRLFGVLAVLAMLPDVLCNSKPLVLVREGRVSLPFLSRLPYAPQEGDRVLRAPLPYSPGDIIDPLSLEPNRRIELTLTPENPTLRVVLTPGEFIPHPSSFILSSPEGSLALIPQFTPGLSLADAFVPCPALSASLAERFANLPSPALSATLTNALDAALLASLSLPEFSPRATPPKTLRVTLRSATPLPPPTRLKLPRANPVAKLPQHLRVPEILEPLAQLQNENSGACGKSGDLPQENENPAFQLSPSTFHISHIAYTLSLSLETVTFPFRPTLQHPCGIDGSGRDVLSRMLHALRIALLFGMLLVASSMCLGAVMGALQGYFGGVTDLAAQRLIEIWSALPFLYIMILLGSVLGRSFTLLLISYGLFNWIGLSYYMRGEFLRLRNRPYIEAARCQGLSSARIMFRHILPNALTPLITLFPFNLVGAISSLTALDFLGFGLPPLTPSWGELLQQAQQHHGSWWLVLFPSIALFALMFLTVLIGEGLRDAFDPKPEAKYR